MLDHGYDGVACLNILENNVIVGLGVSPNSCRSRGEIRGGFYADAYKTPPQKQRLTASA